jgi:phosphopentomutase
VFNRVIILVMDSVGIGALPDAGEYGDDNANTLVNIARSTGGLFLPVFAKMGLGCIADIKGIDKVEKPWASYGKMAEISKAKDTTSGHWELAGCPVFEPFPVYKDGFPSEMIDAFERAIGRKVLGNKPASGTVIIAELGPRHMETGYPIVYTSGDSVFQIAAHEEVIPLEQLYRFCKIAREKICIGEHAVGRVIARPFIGHPGKFVRTANRHDFSLEPPTPTLLDRLKDRHFDVIGVGKIADIFAHRGLTKSYSSKSNDDGMDITMGLAKDVSIRGLIMTNLVEFDSVYGHRNDTKGYAAALRKLDGQLLQLLESLQDNDLLMITADHGCDPTVPGTDHTREYVPLLVYHKGQQGGNLGVRETFADIAATVADNFQIANGPYGRSFLKQL